MNRKVCPEGIPEERAEEVDGVDAGRSVCPGCGRISTGRPFERLPAGCCGWAPEGRGDAALALALCSRHMSDGQLLWYSARLGSGEFFELDEASVAMLCEEIAEAQSRTNGFSRGAGRSRGGEPPRLGWSRSKAGSDGQGAEEGLAGRRGAEDGLEKEPGRRWWQFWKR